MLVPVEECRVGCQVTLLANGVVLRDVLGDGLAVVGSVTAMLGHVEIEFALGDEQDAGVFAGWEAVTSHSAHCVV